MTKVTTTVTEIEYDDNGRVVKETKTVTETPSSPRSGSWVHPPHGYDFTFNAGGESK